jgi:hypothetical protein
MFGCKLRVRDADLAARVREEAAGGVIRGVDVVNGVVRFYHGPATLEEVVHHRGHRGAAVRVAKGLYVGGGTSAPYDRFETVDRGTLTVTPAGLAYFGRFRTVEIPLKALAQVVYGPTHLVLHVHRHTKPIRVRVAAPPHLG